MEKEEKIKIYNIVEEIKSYQKEIARLKLENKELKEDMKVLFKENSNKEKVIIKQQDNWNKLKEHIQECLNEVLENDVYDRTSYEQGIIAGLESSLFKLEELEKGDSNE